MPMTEICALVAGPKAGEEARERLGALEKTSDGFVIAERDLEARGPGDLLGTRQSGLPALRIADPVRDLARLGQWRREVVARHLRGERIASDLFGYPEVRGGARPPTTSPRRRGPDSD